MKVLVVLFLSFVFLVSCDSLDINGVEQQNTPEGVLLSSVDCRRLQEYKVTLIGLWSAGSHSSTFPSKNHFSSPIAISHQNSVRIFEIGQFASVGMESLSETGDISILENEIKVFQISNKVLNYSVGTQLSSGLSRTTLDIAFTDDFSRLSFASMIAPSPDWFVGVSNYNLCLQNRWIESVSLDLYAQDAGTDDGDSFNSADLNAKPKKVIQILESSFARDKNQNLVPFARLVIERRN